MMSSHLDTAHAWAHKTGTNQNASSMYYRDDVIYSYGEHFPMARHVNGTVLFTTRTYSNSTSKHLSRTWSACHHLDPIRVDNVMATTKAEHLVNIKAGMVDASDLVEKAGRARTRGDSYRTNATRVLSSMERYAGLFLPRHKFNFDIDGVMAERKKLEEKEARRDRREQRALEKRLVVEIEEWKTGERGMLSSRVDRVFLRTAPRIEGDREVKIIETSHGANIPYEAGERCFRFAIARRKKGWRRNGDQFKIGVYDLDAVNEHGIVAGCHRVDWQEIERFAKQEEWGSARCVVGD